MPVTFKVASHPANAYKIESDYRRPTNIRDVLLNSSSRELQEVADTPERSSVNPDELYTTIPVSNGFVHTVMEAYGSHYHLRIRYVLASSCYTR